ncbi:MAG: aldose 1-epimerase [Glaciecola sp.]|jgi:aldose 1-epimerase
MTSESGLVHLALGDVEATVSTWGASLRTMDIAGRCVIQQGVGDPEAQYRGSVLVPWPNRTHPVAWRTGPAHGRLETVPGFMDCAIHGLLARCDWTVRQRTPREVVLETVLAPSAGYDHALLVHTRYALTQVGVAAEFTITNRSSHPSPVGIGWHPYFAVEGDVDDAVVHVQHDLVLQPDERSLPCLPTGHLPEWGTRSGGPLRGLVLDHSFRLQAQTEGHLVVLEERGRSVEVRFGPNWKWAHLFTADTFDGGDRRASVAIEPMSCPANALQTGTDLHWLAPGANEVWTAQVAERLHAHR